MWVRGVRAEFGPSGRRSWHSFCIAMAWKAIIVSIIVFIFILSGQSPLKWALQGLVCAIFMSRLSLLPSSASLISFGKGMTGQITLQGLFGGRHLQAYVQSFASGVSCLARIPHQLALNLHALPSGQIGIKGSHEKLEKKRGSYRPRGAEKGTLASPGTLEMRFNFRV